MWCWPWLPWWWWDDNADDDGVGVDDEVEHLLRAVAGPPLLSTSLHHILNTEVLGSWISCSRLDEVSLMGIGMRMIYSRWQACKVTNLNHWRRCGYTSGTRSAEEQVTHCCLFFEIWKYDFWGKPPNLHAGHVWILPGKSWHPLPSPSPPKQFFVLNSLLIMSSCLWRIMLFKRDWYWHIFYMVFQWCTFLPKFTDIWLVDPQLWFGQKFNILAFCFGFAAVWMTGE